MLQWKSVALTTGLLCWLLLCWTAPAATTPPTLAAEEAHYVYENSNLRIRIDRSTGLMDSLISTLPPEQELLPADPKGPVITFGRAGSDEVARGVFGPLKRAPQRDYYKLMADIRFPGEYESYLDGVLTYTLKPETISIRVSVRYLRDEPARYVLHIYNPFRTEDWQNHVIFNWGVYGTPRADAPLDFLYQPNIGDIKPKEYK